MKAVSRMSEAKRLENSRRLVQDARHFVARRFVARRFVARIAPFLARSFSLLRTSAGAVVPCTWPQGVTHAQPKQPGYSFLFVFFPKTNDPLWRSPFPWMGGRASASDLLVRGIGARMGIVPHSFPRNELYTSPNCSSLVSEERAPPSISVYLTNLLSTLHSLLSSHIYAALTAGPQGTAGCVDNEARTVRNTACRETAGGALERMKSQNTLISRQTTAAKAGLPPPPT